MRSTPLSAVVFDDAATVMVALARDGDHLQALTNDPQLCLTPSQPIPAGWCQLVLEVEGRVSNPRVYLDFGEGPLEASSVALEWSDSQQGYRCVTWLPAPVLKVRLDPSDEIDRFRIRAFSVDALTEDQVVDALALAKLRSPLPDPSRGQQVRWALRRMRKRGLEAIGGRETNTRVLFSEHAHLAGLTVRLEDTYAKGATVIMELRAFDANGASLVRRVTVALASADEQGWYYVYWEPIEDSRQRFFMLTCTAMRDGAPIDLSRARVVVAATPFHSPKVDWIEAVRCGERGVSVLYSEHSHLAGLSVRFDEAQAKGTVVTLEVHGFGEGRMDLVRAATVDLSNAGEQGWEHVFWGPIEDSKQRFFMLTWTAGVKVVAAARPFHSHPTAWDEVPHAILFSPVTACNLNCTHCISRPSRNRLQRASEEIWAEVEEVTRHEKFIHLATDYSGDILYNEVRHGGWLSKIIGADVPFRIDTNANYLEDWIVEKLVSSKLTEINFSLDSMDPEVYRKVRRGSIPLADVLGKIAHFMKRKRESGHACRTLMSFVLMRSTAATIKPALAFAKEHGIDHVSLPAMIAWTEDMVEELFVWDEVAYAALYAELSSEAARLGIGLNMQAPVRKWVERDIHAPCDIPWGSMAVLGNGDVQACCVPGTRMGNLNEKSLVEIWNGPEYRDFRMRVNSLDPPEPCRNCSQSRVTNNRKAYAPALYTHLPNDAKAIAMPKLRRAHKSENADA